jgi:hypothetical protein
MTKAAKKSRHFAGAAGAAAVMVSLSALPAHYARADTSPLTVEALIVPTGQAITTPQNLDFGNVIQGAAGTVSVNTAGVPSYIGASGAGGTITEGQIRAFGTNGVVVTYNVTDPTVTLTNGGTGAMQVNGFNIGTDAAGPTKAVTMTANTMTVPVGGTLNVGGASPTGTYTGSVTINAVFN